MGAEIGKSVGRETAISASGGWEAIRASSDRSFDDIHSMARYLKAKYGHTGNFADAMEATRQIYPELAEASRVPTDLIGDIHVQQKQL